jgi:tetratricopeptide (TPR) repeat protein
MAVATYDLTEAQMLRMCPGNRSIASLAAAFAVSNLLVVAAAAAGNEQQSQVQKLFQSGSYEEAVQAAQGADPASVYVAAQALMRLEQADRASAEFGKLAGSGGAWQAIGESGQALVGNDANRAVEAARRATSADGDNPFAHYQLGLAASKANDFGTAAGAFDRAAELKNDFAYAHYYAGLAFQRQRQLPKAAQHFDAFLKLAPEAPERAAVQQIMRTLK